MAVDEATTLDDLDTPALVLDRARMTANIARMRARAGELGVALRPHLKTTKSADIARLAIAQDAGVAVSTLAEAEYFAEAGFRDLFYAVAIAPHKLARLARLVARGCRVLLAVDHLDAAQAVAAAGREHGVVFDALLEIDSGEGRSGIPAASPMLTALAEALARGARLAGVFTHGGHSYAGRTAQAHSDVAEAERLAVTAAAQRLRDAGHACGIVSLGSTPSVRHARHMAGVTEVRAGVYVLGDLFQAGIGACAYGDIALSVLTTVIGNHPERSQIVVDAGSLALSKDVSTSKLGPGGDVGYGIVLDALTGEAIDGLYVETVYQEHGIVRSRGRLNHEAFPIGHRLRILPNHACLTAAAYDRYHVIDPQPGRKPRIEAVWPRINGW